MICSTVKMIEAGKLVFADTIDAFNNVIEPDTMTVSFDNPPTNPELMEIDGVLEINENNGKLEIRFDTSKEVSKNLIELSVKNNWQLKEVGIEKQSLRFNFCTLIREIPLYLPRKGRNQIVLALSCLTH